jgi:hypothetical protein
MSQAFQTHTTPTRRSAGLTAPPIAIATDADLLAACAEFERSGERLDWMNGANTGLTDDECGAEITCWYAALECIAALPIPRTPEGRHAKLKVAYRALASTAISNGDALEREEQFAVDTMREMLGDVS